MCDMNANIMVYDCLGDVVVVARVLDVDLPRGHPDRDLELSLVLPGEGISEPRKWLRNALVELVEAL